MARSRRGRGRNSTPFRAWGLLLAGTAMLLGWRGLWWESALVSGILVLYLLAVRLTRCRVQTSTGRPCLWRVRGLLGTCDYHVGYKRSLPILIRGAGFAGLPMFMWPRDDFSNPTGYSEPQPSRGTTGTAERARRPGYDLGMMGLTAVGVVVTMAALVRDLIAG